CLQDDRPLCAGLFVISHGLIEYHLGGTLSAALKTAPMKLLVDDVRQWGYEQGYSTLHLGGGLSADADDSLLHYKLGFSDRTHEFATWRWIVNREIHDRLCAEKTRWNERHHLQKTPGFFPAYRSPTITAVPRVPAAETFLEERGFATMR